MEYVVYGIAFVAVGFGLAVLFGRAARLGAPADEIKQMDTERL